MANVFRSDVLAGQRALVTGGSRGFGEATIRQFASMGAEVIIADMNVTRGQEIVDELSADGVKASVIGIDLTDRDATRELGRSVGRVDILVNNAAPVQTNTPFLETPESDWELQFAVIMWAPLLLTREIGPRMCEAGSGAIVNISSLAARGGGGPVAAYAAAKAALESLTRGSAAEFGKFGVRTNAVAPSFVPTERNRPAWDLAGFGTDRKWPLGRMCTTQDIADAVAWLASPGASYVNGHVLYVDGGGRGTA